MELTEIRAIAEQNGCAFFGTSSLSDAVPEGYEHLPFAVSFGMRYPGTIIRDIASGPTSTYFHQYRTINANLDRIAVLIQAKLLAGGYEAVYIPASQSLPQNPFRAVLSHKIAAVKAGLGFIGKNNLFIHERFGPAVRLGTVLTNLPLPELSEGVRPKNACIDCAKCVAACPAGALNDVIPKAPYKVGEVFNAEKCSYTMKEKYMHIGRGSVCGICIAVCPFAVKAK